MNKVNLCTKLDNSIFKTATATTMPIISVENNGQFMISSNESNMTHRIVRHFQIHTTNTTCSINYSNQKSKIQKSWKITAFMKGKCIYVKTLPPSEVHSDLHHNGQFLHYQNMRHLNFTSHWSSFRFALQWKVLHFQDMRHQTWPPRDVCLDLHI